MSQYYGLSQFPVSHDLLVLASAFQYRDGIEAVQNLCERQIAACKPDSRERELAHQLLGKMIFLHTSWHPTPAYLARSTLETAISHYPSNTQFHSLFVDNEIRAGLQSRIYAHLLQRSLTESSSELLLWRIWAMAKMSDNIYDPASGGHSRMRSLFSKALSTDSWVSFCADSALTGAVGSASECSGS